MNFSSVEAFQGAIFSVASQHVEGIGIHASEGFAIRSIPVSADRLELIVSFKHLNHFTTLIVSWIMVMPLILTSDRTDISGSVLHNWTARGHTVDFFIWVNVETSAHYSKF